jgi:hypothetical protein
MTSLSEPVSNILLCFALFGFMRATVLVYNAIRGIWNKIVEDCF